VNGGLRRGRTSEDNGRGRRAAVVRPSCGRRTAVTRPLSVNSRRGMSIGEWNLTLVTRGYSRASLNAMPAALRNRIGECGERERCRSRLARKLAHPLVQPEGAIMRNVYPLYAPCLSIR